MEDNFNKVSNIIFNIEENAIDTKNEQRDAHLKSADFFDVEKFPKITLKGKSIKHYGGEAV